MKKPIPTWLIVSAIVLVAILAIVFGAPMVIDPPPAKSFNELPLEERKAAIEGMRGRVKDAREPVKRPPQQTN